ncbi:hypothetical protein V5T82_00900 [Magnetovibrio sp. PR-2]|uniref:hypothetical protein n=1 Tax=Magnetovibrio sp. PR-2 TaxID=3120356 RepID=UPI002FCDE77D
MPTTFKLLILSLGLTLGACGGGATKPVETQKPAETAKPAKPAKPKITPQQLLGAKGPWLLSHMGRPDFSRQDLNAHIWQYKNQACVLNVFLYDENEDFKVLHFDARDAKGSNTDRAACLSTLQD